MKSGLQLQEGIDCVARMRVRFAIVISTTWLASRVTG